MSAAEKKIRTLTAKLARERRSRAETERSRERSERLLHQLLEQKAAAETLLRDRNDQLEKMIVELEAVREKLTISEQEARLANGAKTAFLANMSHELRTPLNAIIGYSEMLLEDDIQEDPEQIEICLQAIYQSGKHLLGLVNDVLDLSKIEAGQYHLASEPVDLEKELMMVVSASKPLIEKHGNTLHVDIDHDGSQTILDPLAFRQCLFNLLGNAGKFTDNGTVTLQVRIAQGDVRIRVQDTGIGIPQERLATIFDEFVQGDLSTTKEYGGTGLGLSITKKLCELQGATIQVESEEGKGTTFEIVHPARKMTQDSPVPSPQAPPKLSAALSTTLAM